MACLRNDTVHEVLSWNEGQYHWNITFTRSLNDWKEERIFSLLSFLADLEVHVHFEGEDKIIWSLDSKGTFSVKNLRNRLLGSNCPPLPTKVIWKSKAPMKAYFLLGQLLMARFP